MPGADPLLWLHRAAGPHSLFAQSGSVLPLCRRRHDGDVRRAELDQHGGELARDAGQGHDPAVHLLRRLVTAGAWPRDGFPAGDHPQAPGRRPAPCGRGGMSGSGSILLAAGGTGGHLFPAAALASALIKRGAAVELATDDRALKYGQDFPARTVHAFPSATTTGAGALSKAQAALTLAAGVAVALMKLAPIRPRAVVGFGGYPTVPPLFAAWLLGIPTVLHEQNAVMGRANRFLSGLASTIALGFPELKGADARLKKKARFTGNPVRPAVMAAAATPYPDVAGRRLNLLVTGGSQGARV